MAMTKPDYIFLAECMKEQLDAAHGGSIRESVLMNSFTQLSVKIDAHYKNFKRAEFNKAVGLSND